MNRIERFREDITQYLKDQALSGFVKATEDLHSNQPSGTLPVETQEALLEAHGIHLTIATISALSSTHFFEQIFSI